MGESTKIEWADHTWSPWRGCTNKLLADGTPHSGCEHCYAEALAKRNPSTLGVWGDGGTRVVAAPKSWRAIELWNVEAERLNRRETVFPSLCDPFEDWTGEMHSHDGVAIPGGMAAVRENLFDLIDHTPNLFWLLLTKRPENVRKMWPEVHGAARYSPYRRRNVGILYSASDQKSYDNGIEHLLRLRDLCPLLGLSLEPLVGPIRTATKRSDGWFVDSLRGVYERVRDAGVDHPGGIETHCDGPHLDWVIVGGESGHGARPMRPHWARSIRDQCVAAGVPFFFKQWGEYRPYDNCTDPLAAEASELPSGVIRLRRVGWSEGDELMRHVGKSAAGRLLDGREWSEFPQAIRGTQ